MPSCSLWLSFSTHSDHLLRFFSPSNSSLEDEETNKAELQFLASGGATEGNTATRALDGAPLFTRAAYAQINGNDRVAMSRFKSLLGCVKTTFF